MDKKLRRLTQKQLYVFSVISEGVLNGTPYSLSDILKRVPMEIKRNAIWYHIKAIKQKGYLNNVEGKYYPTRGGIQQRMADFGKVKEVAQSDKNRIRTIIGTFEAQIGRQDDRGDIRGTPSTPSAEQAENT